jgi:hypothetical protein
MKNRTIIGVAAAAALLVSGIAYAQFGDSRTIHIFFAGHTHDEDGNTINAPQHSGGTDRNGCHNGSVPYHCH